MAKSDKARKATLAERRRPAAKFESAIEIKRQLIAELENVMRQNAEILGDLGQSDGELLGPDFRTALTNKAAELNNITVLNRSVKDRNEYDLVGYNAHQVFVGEIKRKLTAHDVKAFYKHRLPNFSKDFPKYSKKRAVYGMLGALTITPAAARAAQTCQLILLKLNNNELSVENFPRPPRRHDFDNAKNL